MCVQSTVCVVARNDTVEAVAPHLSLLGYNGILIGSLILKIPIGLTKTANLKAVDMNVKTRVRQSLDKPLQ